jgi:hypothetical protein
MQTLRKTLSLAVVGVALAASAAPVAAQRLAQGLPVNSDVGVTRVGTRGLNFLELGVGARATALGGAYSAVAEGLTSLYWNVAGLADIGGLSAAASYQDLYENSGLSNAYVAVGMKVGEGAVGLSLTRFSSGEITRTTAQYPDGFDPAFGSTIEWIGSAVGVSYGRRITDRLAFGVTAKLAQEGVDFADASWVGADVGTIFRTGLLSSTIAVAVSNLGGKANMEGSAINRRITGSTRDPQFPTGRDINTELRTAENQMPTIFRFGLRTELMGTADALVRPDPNHSLTLLSELNDAIDAPITPVLALEYGFHDRFFVRGSKRWLRDDRAPFDFGDGLAAGLGMRLPVFGRRLALDYAYQTFDPLGSSQTVSFELGF